ncbi:MAG: hypothetical protein N2554_02385 [Fimbriimonadales bacterium]|nr:hypothetical protein [Fimbriimonadales bacterium]
MRDDCTSLERLLHDYAEGWLEAAEQGRLTRHLEGCFNCQEKLKAWSAVGRALRELPCLPAPAPASVTPVNEGEPEFALRLALAMCLPVALMITAYSRQWRPPEWEQLMPYESLLRLTERAQDWVITLWIWLRGVL